MCPRSGEKMDRRSSTRRTIVNSVSKIGTPSARMGTKRDTAVEVFCEAPARDTVPSTNPMKLTSPSPP